MEFSDADHDLELESMFNATPKLVYALSHYMAHRLRARVQFHAIDKLKDELKSDPSKMLIVMDHKQKNLQMKYREGQVEYYGKKGMSMLGTMKVQWKSHAGTTGSGFQYSFVDYIFKGYAGQDNVQVASAIENIVQKVKEHHPEVEELIFQSDNASCFASQELIPFIYHLNAESQVNGCPKISTWIFTEAQTGRGRLDTHFSYLNLILKAFVEDGNDIMLEENILQAMAFRGGIAGTTAVLLDVGNLPGTSISKKFKSSKVGSRATHEVCWYADRIHIYESSGITTPEIIKKAKLDKHTKNHLSSKVAGSFCSAKPPLFVKETIDNAESANPTEGTTSKAQRFEQALLQAGIVRIVASCSNLPCNSTATPPGVDLKWAGYPGNNPYKLNRTCIMKLKELYDVGKTSKKRKVGAERAHQILLDTVIFDQWDQQLVVTVPKIKAFFQLNPRKMEKALDSCSLEVEEVDEAARALVEDERAINAESLMDDLQADVVAEPDSEFDNLLELFFY